jgi:hypothetical protein
METYGARCRFPLHPYLLLPGIHIYILSQLGKLAIGTAWAISSAYITFGILRQLNTFLSFVTFRSHSITSWFHFHISRTIYPTHNGTL